MTDTLSTELIRGLPKVVLHDHLDGGLRPETILELADDCQYDGLPTNDPAKLAAWFREGADQGNLTAYLAGFDHVCAVLQTAQGLHRAAREFVEDLAADGVVHGEVRFAPERHTQSDLTMDDVIEAVTDGLAMGARDTGISIGTILTVMRSSENAEKVAQAAVLWRAMTEDQPGAIVGLDLAGPERGHPAEAHLDGFRVAHDAGLRVTIHAGEAAGLDSIRSALHPCGADRLGHGVRIIDDISDNGMLGRLAAYVRDRGVPLELCPTSNVHTGVATSFAEHPLPRLRDLGFHVTLNPDDRLMSGTTVTDEYQNAVDQWGWDLDDLEYVVIAATQAAFLPLPERARLLREVIRPAFADARKATA